MKTQVTVTYEATGLSEDGNKLAEGNNQQHIDMMMKGWQEHIAAALAKFKE